MDNNKKGSRELRACSFKGKYFFAWCLLDEEGGVEKILNEDVELSFKSMDELKNLVEELKKAREKAIIHKNSCNSRLLRPEVG